MLDGFPTRAAWALCTFAYSAGPGTQPVLFEGRTDGKIVPARGPATFGWDPVFEAEGTGLTYVFVLILFSIQLLPPTPPFSSHIYLFSRTEGADTWRCDVLVPFFFCCSYAEMEATQKNAISHRGRALQKLRDYLQAPGVESA